ncbi:MAG: hypothetical protein QXW71_00855 [Thermoplasmata archaeon]
MTIETIYKRLYSEIYKNKKEENKESQKEIKKRESKKEDIKREFVYLKVLEDIPGEFIILVEEIREDILKFYKVIGKEYNKAIIALGPYKKGQVIKLDKEIAETILKYYGGKFFVKTLEWLK